MSPKHGYSNVRRQNASLERGILFLGPVHFYARHGGLAKMPARAKQFALAPRARSVVFYGHFDIIETDRE